MGSITGFIKQALNMKEKEYTLGEAMKVLKKEGNESYMPVPIEPGNIHTKYWLRKEESVIKDFPEVKLEETHFQQKRRKMMQEINYNVTYDVNKNHNVGTGRVTKYNDYKSARNYQKKYGPTR